MGESDFSGPFIVGFGLRPFRRGPCQTPQGRPRDIPVPALEASAHASVYDDAGPAHVSRSRHGPYCLLQDGKHRRPEVGFRRSMAGPRYPLSTLRFDPRGSPRMTRGRCGSLRLHRRGLTWAFSGQGVRFIGTSKLRLLFRYPRSEPYFMTWLVPHQIKLTSGRHSKQLHQYPAFGGWGSGGRDHSFTRLFKPVLCSVPIAWIRQDRLGPGDWGIVLERLRSDGLHRGALDDDAAG